MPITSSAPLIQITISVDIRAAVRARWGFLLARQSVSLGVEGEGEMLQLLRIREQADGKWRALLP